MAQASYSFLDVAALDGVRERFAAGDALAILSDDLEEVIWANGPGAALFGHADVETIFGAEAPLGAAAKRQIAAIRGFPEIGRDRALLVRVAKGVNSSQALPFFASAVTLPDGEKAILLAQPAKGEGTEAKAIGGFAEPGHYVAFVNRSGAVEAASPGFDRLGVTQEALAELASEANDERRIVKRLVSARRGLPAGLAKLTDDRHLLVVIDERYAEKDEETPEAIEAATEQAEPVREIWYLGSDQVGEIEVAPTDEQAVEPHTQTADAEPVANTQAPETEPTEVVEPAGQPIIASSAAEVEEQTTAVKPSGATATDEPLAGGPAAEPIKEEELATASVEGTPVQRATGPVRFVWRTDADGKFSQISPDFALAVGEEAADIRGRRFQDVANTFGLDPTGDIAGLLARRDTWSGRSVFWPVAGTDLKIPVDLAALPVYDRNRNFEGFRGFGVARPGDAVVDPEGIGLVLVRLPPAEEFSEADTSAEAPEIDSENQAARTDEPPNASEPIATVEPTESDAAPDEIVAREEKPDPFRGEKPVLTIVPAPDRRQSDKIIRLAEHRPPAQDRGAVGEKALSTGERLAFQQIGERLKKESGQSGPAPDLEAEETEAKTREARSAAANDADEVPKPIESEASGAAEHPDEAADDAAAIADLQALDGVTESELTSVEAETPASTVAAEAEIQSEMAQPAAVEEPAARRKGPRPGLSLLDFAQWSKEEPGASQDETRSAALVEMEEAAALDERATASADQEAPSETDTAAAEAEAGTAEIEGKEPAELSAANDTRAENDVASEVETSAEADRQSVDPAIALSEAGTAEPLEAAEESEVLALEMAEPEASVAAAEKSGAGFSILEKLPVPVLVHSGDTLHYANDEFFALTGYGSIGELAEAGGIGALFADPYEDDADFEPRPKTDRHMRLKARDGQEFPVEAFLQSVPWNDGKALVLVLSRVKEGFGGQSPLIAELEARVAEMRTIIDTATDGVVLIARDGTIRSISRPAEALFGLDSDEVAGKPFFSLFAIESQKAARDYLNGLTDHGVASILNDGREVIGREAEGRFIPLFMTIGKLPSDSGYCAVVRDITQWKRAEEELTQARATAERSSSHKTEFLARVSHEIRTPLNAIIGFSELMLDEKFGPVANDRYRDYLRDINRSGNHVLDLVNDLLDISKIEAGQQEMSYEAVSLNETLAETVAMMQPQANRERVIIRSSFASKLPEVVADLRSVRQIALNVLSNAVRYTQAGGQVIVSTAYEAQGEVVMRVRDTGIGMTHAEIEQALKPFKQINSLKRTRGDGTGLGLPLTKAMVEANRAKFSIHSTPGEGTLVEVAFPSTRVLAD